MARLTSTAGMIPLVTGIATATALSGAAVLTVASAGCEDPGRYRVRGGVVELVGGCVTRQDFPPAPVPDPLVRHPRDVDTTVTDPVLRP